MTLSSRSPISPQHNNPPNKSAVHTSENKAGLSPRDATWNSTDRRGFRPETCVRSSPMKWTFAKLRADLARSAAEAHRWFRAGNVFWKWLGLTVAVLFMFYVLSGSLSDRIRWAGT